MEWNYLSIPKHERFNRSDLGNELVILLHTLLVVWLLIYDTIFIWPERTNLVCILFIYNNVDVSNNKGQIKTDSYNTSIARLILTVLSHEYHVASNYQHLDCLSTSNMSRLTTKKTSKRHDIRPLWGEAGNSWIPLTQDQNYRKGFHVMMSILMG